MWYFERMVSHISEGKWAKYKKQLDKENYPVFLRRQGVLCPALTRMNATALFWLTHWGIGEQRFFSLFLSLALPLPRLRIRSNRMESDFLPFELRPPPPPPVAHLEFLPLIPLTYHYSPSRQNFSSPTVFCTKLMPICLWLLFRKSFPRSTRVEKDLVQFQLLMQIETY